MIEELARLVGMQVHPVDLQFEARLHKLPLGQRRTSRNKAYVYVSDDVVFKGPHAGSSLKLVNNLRFPALIRQLEDALDLPAAMRGAFAWSDLYACRSGRDVVYYVAAQNLGNASEMKIETASTQVDSAFQVVERESMLVRVSEIEKVKVGSQYMRHPRFDEQIALASLQHLYLRFLLNVGDSSTMNILLRGGGDGPLVAGVDFDEIRGARTTDNLWYCLFRGNYSYLPILYRDLLTSLVMLRSIGAAVQNYVAQVNGVCREWCRCLPEKRRADAIVDVAKIIPRSQLVESYISSLAREAAHGLAAVRS